MLGILLRLVAAVALAGAAAAVGSARVVNQCPLAVTTWSVGGAVSGPHRLRPGGGAYGEPFARDPQTGGRALKTTVAADGLYTGKPQAVFAYSLQPGAVWYDLSSVFGNAFQGHRLVVASADAACEAIAWDDGTPLAGSHVKSCHDAANVTLTLCAA